MSDPRPIVVGVLRTAYRERRNFIDLPHQDVTFRKVLDPCRVVDAALYRVLGSSPDLVRYTHVDVGVPRVDLFHHFFSIALTRRPWVLSLSSFVPRWNRASRWGLRRLAAPSCRRIVAISQNSWDIQHAELDRVPDLRADIEAKATVVHPAQAPLIGSWDEKPLADDAVSLAFIGRQLFRKGGLEVLRVVSRALDAGASIRLTLVGSIRAGDDAAGTGEAEVAEARGLLARHASSIEHHDRLPHDEVIALLRRSHAALLPTYADTYGYVVLEAQACATPVVTTNVRALPEIAGDDTGWVLDVPRDSLRNALVDDEPSRRAFSSALEEQLEAVVADILAHPDRVRRRGEAALARIHAEHDPADRARALREIYEGALAR